MLGIEYEGNRIIEIEKQGDGLIAVHDDPSTRGFSIREAVAGTLSPESHRDTRR